jgi:spore germination protein YaaH
MSRRTLLAGGAALAVLVVAVVAVVHAVASDRAPLVAAAWLPVWDERSPDSLRVALDEGGVTEVSPTWAVLQPDGDVVLTPPSREVRRLLADSGARVLPAVQNFSDGEWQGQAVADLLADPLRARAHRERLVQLAVRHGWDGVDIDYESLPPTAGPHFTDFLEALRDDLHARGLELSVAVPARPEDASPHALAYSYQLIGAIADQVRLMTYDHAWSTSPAGPVAPPDWIEQVVEYAVERVPSEKLMLGLATYGYDWVGSTGTNLQAVDAVALADRLGVDPRWDDAAAAHTFDYEQDGRRHTVWFEDARSLAVKQRIAVEHGLRGVAIWQLGGEDLRLWESVGDVTRGGAR